MNFDPIHYAAVALGILLFLVVSIGGTAYWEQGMQLKLCESNYETFRSSTKAEGLAAELDTKSREHDLSMAAINIQQELNHAYTSLSASHADNERLRHDKASAGRLKIVNLSEGAARISCPDARSEFAERLERLDLGVRERLLKSRDEAILRTIACKKWVEEVETIVNKAHQ